MRHVRWRTACSIVVFADTADNDEDELLLLGADECREDGFSSS